MNPEQPGFLISALQKMSPEATIVLAMDNDEAGDLMIEKLKGVFLAAGISEKRFFVSRPVTRGQDWNDTLQEPLRAKNHQEASPEP